MQARRQLLRLTQARRRLLHLHRASGCFGMSCGLLRDSSSTTSPRVGLSSTTLTTPRVRLLRHVVRLVARPVVDYFSSAARPGASARRAARRQLLRLRCGSGCFGTSRSSSHGLSSTTSTTPRVRLLRHVARLVPPLVVHNFASRRLVIDHFTSRRLVVDYFTYTARPVASARCAACRVTHRRLLRLA
jgi:hypothetical protein